MTEPYPCCVATDAGQPCPDVVTSTVPAPLCQRHRMQIASVIVLEMLQTAAGVVVKPNATGSPWISAIMGGDPK